MKGGAQRQGAATRARKGWVGWRGSLLLPPSQSLLQRAEEQARKGRGRAPVEGG